MQQLCEKQKIITLRRIQGVSTVLIRCLGLQRCNMSLKLHFLPSHLDFSWEIWQPSLTSTVKVSTRIYPEWKIDTAAKGTQIFWLITAGDFYWRHQQKNTRDERRQNEFLKLHLFICGRILYIETIFTFITQYNKFKKIHSFLTFWRRNYFFNFSTLSI